MRLRTIESIAQEENIKYRKALGIFKRANIKIYGTGTDKKVDADLADELFSERERRQDSWKRGYDKYMNERFHV